MKMIEQLSETYEIPVLNYIRPTRSSAKPPACTAWWPM